MKRIVRLTERDLTRLVKRVITENEKSEGSINEFWPFTKRKKQPEPEKEVYKPTKPPREVLIDLEQVPGFFDLRSDSRPNETKVWLLGDYGNPVYLGFKEVYGNINGNMQEAAVKYTIQYIKETNSIKVKKDYFYDVYGDRNQYVGDRRLEYPKGGQEDVEIYQNSSGRFFEKGDSMRGLDILDVKY